MVKSLPIPRDLLDWISYDPTTGEFLWKRDLSGVKAGTPAGYVRARKGSGQSYRVIRFRGHAYHAHRIAWLAMTGQEPVAMIDHRDCDGLNNRWENLRQATAAQNQANRHSFGRHKKGAHIFKGRWQANIKVAGKRIHLGTFGTEEEAHSAYMAAAREHFGEFARAA